MEKSLKIAKKKLFWVLLKAINSLFIITLKDFEKKLTIKSWFCQEFHFTYNNSHKLLRPTQFLKNFLEILKWSTLYQASPPPPTWVRTPKFVPRNFLSYLQLRLIMGRGGLVLGFMWVVVDSSRKSSVFKSIIKYLTSYCPLIWMFCSRTSNNMTNRIHECLLRVILDDKTNSFADVLTKIRTIKTKINHKPSAEFSGLNDAAFQTYE